MPTTYDRRVAAISLGTGSSDIAALTLLRSEDMGLPLIEGTNVHTQPVMLSSHSVTW